MKQAAYIRSSGDELLHKYFIHYSRSRPAPACARPTGRAGRPTDESLTSIGNRQSTFGNSSFSLIELLVVVAIIAILVGLLLAGIQSARNHARKVIAMTEVREIQKTWEIYRTEMGKWPSFASETDPVAVTGDVARLLQGEVSPTNNPQGKQYLDLKRESIMNPWWKPGLTESNYCYYAKFDVDYNNVINFFGTNNVRASVIVWTVNTSDGSVIGSWK